MWPEVVFGPDIAVVLGITEDEAITGLRTGRFGPYLEINGRPAVQRRELLEALSQRANSANKEVLS